MFDIKIPTNALMPISLVNVKFSDGSLHERNIQFESFPLLMNLGRFLNQYFLMVAINVVMEIVIFICVSFVRSNNVDAVVL